MLKMSIEVTFAGVNSWWRAGGFWGAGCIKILGVGNFYVQSLFLNILSSPFINCIRVCMCVCVR